MNRYSLLIALPLLGFQAASATSSFSVPAYTEEKQETWDLQISSFLWAPSISGKMAPFKRGAAVEVDRSLSDTISNLDLGSFVNIWARHGRLVFSGNIMYSDATDRDKYDNLPAFQVPGMTVIIPPGASMSGKAKTIQFMTTMMSGYRIMDTENYTLDVLGGFRYWYISNDVTVNAYHPSIGSRRASYGEKFWWIDPLIGARAFVPITNNIAFQSEIDAGGMGVGSDYTWSMLASINYTFINNLTVSAGYKAFKVNYDRQDHVHNILQSGPILGATWHF